MQASSQPKSPDKKQVYAKQVPIDKGSQGTDDVVILARAESMDPVWQSATTQMAKMKCARELRNRRYRIEQSMTIFVLISVVATALSMQFGVIGMTGAVNLKGWQPDIAVNILRAVVSTCTLFLLVLLVVRTDTVCKLRIVTHRLPPHVKFYFPSAGLLGKMLFEAFIILLHVPPSWHHAFVDSRFMGSSIFNATSNSRYCPTDGHRMDAQTYFCYSDIPWHSSQLDAIGFLRLYVLFRYVRHRLGFESVDIEWLGTEWHVPTSSLGFTTKYMFHQHPLPFAVLSFLTTWLTTGLIVEFFEFRINPEIDSNVEALWLTVLTMSSAGLGSIPPLSFQGQIGIITGGIIGGAIMGALITSVLIASLRVTSDEEAVIDTLEARKLETEHQLAAIRVLEHFAHLVVLKARKASPSLLRAAKTKLFSYVSHVIASFTRHPHPRATLAFKENRHELAHLSHSTDQVLDHKTADVLFRTAALFDHPASSRSFVLKTTHGEDALDTLERKLHAIHGALARRR
ncbi:Aste57867_13730 [Aphanomyces stellatus]|uniref:Aste57867_13730 protein n=1 Tax=Aphanomyces stellatus TaxID=120398 RepID=A0A485KYW4_9STRA|nr:hypothetical protein As57867_013680 [Aphanomyces stellatus]VFT90563.1 Aste57867_13730 [Aphanomyces stellatus]